MAYDPAGRLTYQNWGDTVPSEPTGNSDYAYDAAGNPTAISELGGSDEAQTFDAAGEVLTSDQGDSLSYTYDTIGDRTNVTDETEDSDVGDYGFDQTGQMVSSSVSDTDTAYLYNGDGLEYGATSGASTQEFVWATLNSEPLILSDGVNAYIYGPGATPVEEVDMSSSTPTFVNFNQADGLSSYAMTDSSGDATEGLEYSADGAQLELDLGVVPSGFGYAGQYQDAATGLYNMRARWYDPSTDVFTSVDPDLASTDQPYSYAADDPVNNSDPLGLWCVFGHNPNGGCRGKATVVNAWHNADNAYQCVSSACYANRTGGANAVAGAHNTFNNLAGLPSVPAPYPCSNPDAYDLGGQLPYYVGGLLVPGAGELGIAEVPFTEAGAEVAAEGAASNAASIQEVLSGLEMGRNYPVVGSQADLNQVFGQLARGGQVTQNTGGRLLVGLPDGTTVQYRTFSGSGGDTIDVQYPDGSESKVYIQ